MEKTLRPARISGEIDIPGSKSHTIRALLIALFAHGRSRLCNALDSQDTKACIQLCERIGAKTTWAKAEGQRHPTLVVDSSEVRLNAKSADEKPLVIDCSNSGTTLYLASAMCAAGLGARPMEFRGDAQLSKRPVSPLLNSLSDLGAAIVRTADELPFTIRGPLSAGRTSIECRTSQYLSALLLACPLASGETSIEVPLLNEKPYVRMTQYWLDKQNIEYECNDRLSSFRIKGNQAYRPFNGFIGGDYSSATFFFCGAAMTGGCITVNGLDRDDPQGDKAVLDILSKMGCNVKWNGNAVTVNGPQRLKAGTFDLNDIPDALPALAVASCFADGPVRLYNVRQARLKETDRIAAMAGCITKLGGRVKELEDGLEIHPVDGFDATRIDGYGDHRIVMAMALASLRSRSALTIEDAQVADVTFPTFFELFARTSV